MFKVYIIINETHKLTVEQKDQIYEFIDYILDDEYKGLRDYESYIEHIKIPATGIKLVEMEKLAEEIYENYVVFVSPVPALMKLVAEKKQDKMGGSIKKSMVVFHNDKREKIELPNGKVISVVAKDGWKLV